MKKIRVDFSKSGELECLRPVSKIASTCYEAERSGIPIFMDEETTIIYAPICTKSHFEMFYGNVFEEEEENGSILADGKDN